MKLRPLPERAVPHRTGIFQHRTNIVHNENERLETGNFLHNFVQKANATEQL